MGDQRMGRCLGGWWRYRVGGVLAAAAGVGLLVASASGRALTQQNGTYVPSAVNRVPDVNQQNEMRERQNDESRIEAANAERKKEITADSEKLLKMAADLKDELDKTDQDTLSLDAIHKIEAIQKLARSMKDKLRLRTN